MHFMAYVLCALFGFSYLFLIKRYINRWKSIPEFSDYGDLPVNPFLSIIVTARNEEKNLFRCLSSILKLNYPIDKFEIIIVDDHSSDKTAEIANAFKYEFQQFHLISLKDGNKNDPLISPKRRALEAGILISKGEIILLTDADCEVPDQWARSISTLFIKKNIVFVGGPVLIDMENQNILSIFQALDMIGMMIITGAGYYNGNQLLANGANMAFSKKAFLETGGFSNFPAKASGDDMFLLHKLNDKYPGSIQFLKTLKGAVKTRPTETLGAFIQQRIRWASKNRNYKNQNISISLLLIFLLSSLIIFLLILSFINFKLFFPFFIVLYLSKFLGDYLLQKEAISYFKEKKLSNYIFICQNIHTLYIFFIGIAGNILPRYQWKGRIVK